MSTPYYSSFNHYTLQFRNQLYECISYKLIGSSHSLSEGRRVREIWCVLLLQKRSVKAFFSAKFINLIKSYRYFLCTLTKMMHNSETQEGVLKFASCTCGDVEFDFDMCHFGLEIPCGGSWL